MAKVLTVRVIPNAKKNEIVEDGKNLKIHVISPATDGKANNSVIAILSEYFGTKKSRIRIIKGYKSRKKVVEIDL